VCDVCNDLICRNEWTNGNLVVEFKDSNNIYIDRGKCAFDHSLFLTKNIGLRTYSLRLEI
jgi:hypothetical protein